MQKRTELGRAFLPGHLHTPPDSVYRYTGTGKPVPVQGQRGVSTVRAAVDPDSESYRV